MDNYKSKEIINSNLLFRKFERHAFVGDKNEKYVIEKIEIEAIRVSNLLASDLESLNRKIFKYMDQKGEKEYEKFTEYLTKAKIIKPLNLNIKQIRENKYKELKEIEQLINEMEAILNA